MVAFGDHPQSMMDLLLGFVSVALCRRQHHV